MVDVYGIWTVEEDYSKYPVEKWCLCDYIADAIRKTGYEIKTTMENLIIMILLHIDSTIEDGIDIEKDNPEDIMWWVNEYGGGLSEFDYEC